MRIKKNGITYKVLTCRSPVLIEIKTLLLYSIKNIRESIDYFHSYIFQVIFQHIFLVSLFFYDLKEIQMASFLLIYFRFLSLFSVPKRIVCFVMDMLYAFFIPYTNICSVFVLYVTAMVFFNVVFRFQGFFLPGQSRQYSVH